MKLYSRFLLALTATLPAAVHAATFTFDSASDYTSNFTPGFTSNTGSGGTAPFWNGSTYPGHMVKFDATGSGSASFATLNQAAAGTSYTVKADVLFSPTNGTYSAGALSFSFLTNIGTDNGYAAIFRFTGSNTADFRIFEGVNATAGTLGTQVFGATPAQTITLSSGTWSTTTFYTLSLDVLNTGTAISFTGSVLTTGGAVLGTFNTYTDSTPSSVANTAVGFRMGVGATDVLRMDNFSIPTSAIPEPSTYALLGGAGVLGLALCARRKRT